MAIRRAVLTHCRHRRLHALHAVEPDAPGPRATDGGGAAGVGDRRRQRSEAGRSWRATPRSSGRPTATPKCWCCDRLSRMRESFLARRERFKKDIACECASCAQLDNLSLKFVVHLGEVAEQRVKRHVELARLRRHPGASHAEKPGTSDRIRADDRSRRCVPRRVDALAVQAADPRSSTASEKRRHTTSTSPRHEVSAAPPERSFFRPARATVEASS